jgi:hypothetical protein
MKQIISLAVLLMITLATFSQKVWIDTVKPFVPPSGTNPIRIGVLIGDNQRFDKANSEDILITPPTIIEQTPNFVKLYVNTDHISIVCTGITEKNQVDYQAFKSIGSGQSMNAYPINYSVSADNPTILDDPQLNSEKARLHNFKFYYFLKDKSGKLVADLTLEFVMPAPEPLCLTSNDTIIDRLKESSRLLNPRFAINIRNLENYDKQVAAAKKAGGVTNRIILHHPKRSLAVFFKSIDRIYESPIAYRLNNGEWKISENSTRPSIILENLKPGIHILQARYPRQPDAVFSYEIELHPGPMETTTFKVIAGSCIITIFFLGAFLLARLRQKRRSKAEMQKRVQLENHLDALQSRLHPHFIFNALNSIQGLINRKDTESANLYISKFGALLHDIIDSSHELMHPLEVELKHLTYYLQLEQLRFKFRYTITVGEAINASEINIPTLLLQPFIENAIKHGIAEKKEEGLVTISITRNNENLVIAITDNGKGYDPTTPTEGRGNIIVQEKVNTLNEFLIGQKISIDIRSAAHKGTQVLLYFNHWL